MSQPIEKNNNPETKKRILQYCNDVLHEELAKNSIVVVAVHNRADPRKFIVVADTEYDRQLENVELVFNNPEDYKRIFPEFSAPPPVVLAPNMEMDRRLGVAVPIHKDPYKIKSIVGFPQSMNPKINGINNVLNDNNDEYWSVKATEEKPATVIMDLGKDSDIGTLWVKWHAAKERRTKFMVAVATDEQYNSQNRTFTVIDRLNGKYSSGTTDDFEPYNLSDDPEISVFARYVMLKIYGDNQDGSWASVKQLRVTKAMAVKSLETELKMAPKKSDTNK